jgi:hypothetical protein
MIKLRESGHPVARDLVEAVLLLVIKFAGERIRS